MPIQTASRHPCLTEDYQIVLEQGADWDFVAQVKGKDLTDHTFIGEIHKRPGDGELIANFAISPVDLPNGKIRIQVSSDLTDSLDFENDIYYYDIFTISPGGFKNNILSGRVRLAVKA
jgi:hypothetical protein